MKIIVKYENDNVSRAPIEMAIEVPDDQCLNMVEEDYRQRPESAEDKSSVTRRSPQEIMGTGSTSRSTTSGTGRTGIAGKYRNRSASTMRKPMTRTAWTLYRTIPTRKIAAAAMTMKPSARKSAAC